MSGGSADDIERLEEALRDIECAKSDVGGNYPAKMHLAAASNKIEEVLQS